MKNAEIAERFKIRCSGIGQIMSNGRGKEPTMGATAKTFCLDWIKEQPEFFNRRNEFNSKYTDKGNAVEQAVLNMVASQLNYGMLLKNEEWFEGDFATGTPDNIQKDHVIDVKSSWDFSTFPIFDTEPDKKYWWQGQ